MSDEARPKEISDRREARIQRQIAGDPDAPEATDAQIAEAKPFSEMFPDLSESIKNSRGRPRKEHAKEAVTLRIDPRVVERFKAAGDDWRARMARVIEKAR